MRARLIRIGNSRGIRIPKTLQAEVGLRDEVELSVRGSEIVIRAAHHPRAAWEAAFAEMARRGDDELLDAGNPATEWDRTQWKWEKR